LSAVDPKVADHLVEQCVRERLCNDLNVGVVLVTHQRQFLERADRVVVLSRDGKALANASLFDVLEQGGEAADIIRGAGGFEMKRTITLELIPDGDVDVRPGSPQKDYGKQLSSSSEEPTKKKKEAAVAIVTKEDREVGTITWATWRAFIGAGGAFLSFLVLAAFAAAEGTLLYSDVLLLRWSERDHQRTRSEIYARYVSFVLCACVLGAVRGIVLFSVTLKASNSLHARAIRRVLCAPLSWFQANPLGRVLNRFSADLAMTDDQLSKFLCDFCIFGFMTLGAILIITVVMPPILLLMPVIFYFALRTKRYAMKSMTELKRLDGLSRSPVLSVVSATLHGLSPIRAFGAAELQTKSLQRTLTVNATAFYWWLLSGRYMGLVLDSYTILFTVAFVAAAVATRGLIPTELVAVALIYALQLVGNVQYSVKLFAQVEQYLTSVERLMAYVRLDVEGEGDVLDRSAQSARGGDGTMMLRQLSSSLGMSASSSRVGISETSAWPSAGAIEVVDLAYRYRADLPLVLKNVTISFPPRSKTGLCGRTGSGKSSTLAALSRLHDVCGGSVIIDGVDVATVPLADLRAAIAVIPQVCCC